MAQLLQAALARVTLGDGEELGAAASGLMIGRSAITVPMISSQK